MVSAGRSMPVVSSCLVPSQAASCRLRPSSTVPVITGASCWCSESDEREASTWALDRTWRVATDRHERMHRRYARRPHVSSRSRCSITTLSIAALLDASFCQCPRRPSEKARSRDAFATPRSRVSWGAPSSWVRYVSRRTGGDRILWPSLTQTRRDTLAAIHAKTCVEMIAMSAWRFHDRYISGSVDA
jgi:hypothetical protein